MWERCGAFINLERILPLPAAAARAGAVAARGLLSSYSLVRARSDTRANPLGDAANIRPLDFRYRKERPFHLSLPPPLPPPPPPPPPRMTRAISSATCVRPPARRPRGRRTCRRSRSTLQAYLYEDVSRSAAANALSKLLPGLYSLPVFSSYVSPERSRVFDRSNRSTAAARPRARMRLPRDISIATSRSFREIVPLLIYRVLCRMLHETS